MKKLFAIVALIICMVVVAPVHADQSETVTIRKDQLTDQQKAQVEADTIKSKVETYGKWVGIGHELGTAVNESLTAVTTQANNFAQTPVGKLTAALVIWKVVGHDAMGFIIGIAEILIILPLWVWSYRRFLPRRVIKQENLDPTTGKVISRIYQDSDIEDWDGWCIGHWFALAILFTTSIWVMFA